MVSSYESNLWVSGSTFDNCEATKSGGILFSYSCNVDIDTSTFTNFFGSTGIVLEQSETLTITDSSFSDGGSESFNGGALRLDMVDYFEVTGSTFYDLRAQKGGAFYFCSCSSNSYIICGNNFTRCNASRGGAILNG